MNKYSLAFLCLLIVFKANTAEISLGLAKDSDFNNTMIDSYWNLSEESALIVDYSQSKYSDEQVSEFKFKQFSIGYERSIGENFSILISTYSQDETENIKARGLGLEGSYRLSALWDGEKDTNITLGLKTKRFSQNKDGDETVDLNKKFWQREVNLVFAQDILSWFSFSLSFTKYRYSEDLDSFMRSYNSRYVYNSNLDALVFGFSDYVNSANFNFSITEKFDLSFGGGKAETKVDAVETKFSSLDLSYQFTDSFSMGIGLNSSKTEGQESKATSMNFSVLF